MDAPTQNNHFILHQSIPIIVRVFSASFCIYTLTHLLGLRIRPHLTSQRPHLLPRHAFYSAPSLPFSSRFTSLLSLASALPSLLLLFFCLPQCLGKRNPSDCHTMIALSCCGHTLCASFGFLGVCCCAPHWLGDCQHITGKFFFLFFFFLY